MKILLLILSIILIITSLSCKKSIPDGCIDKSKINSFCPCNTYYDPVCGCDHKTYPNSCEADCAGVTSYSKGKCR